MNLSQVNIKKSFKRVDSDCVSFGVLDSFTKGIVLQTKKTKKLSQTKKRDKPTPKILSSNSIAKQLCKFLDQSY